MTRFPQPSGGGGGGTTIQQSDNVVFPIPELPSVETPLNSPVESGHFYLPISEMFDGTVYVNLSAHMNFMGVDSHAVFRLTSPGDRGVGGQVRVVDTVSGGSDEGYRFVESGWVEWPRPTPNNFYWILDPGIDAKSQVNSARLFVSSNKEFL